MLAVGCGRPSQESQVAQLTKAPLAPLEESQADLPLEPQAEPAPMQALWARLAADSAGGVHLPRVWGYPFLP